MIREKQKATPLRLKLLSGDETAAKRGEPISRFSLRPRRRVVSPYARVRVYVQAAASSKLQGAFACQPMPDWSGGIGRRLLAGGPSPCGRARRRREGSRRGRRGEEAAWPAGGAAARSGGAGERGTGRDGTGGVCENNGGRIRRSSRRERWGGVFNCPEGMLVLEEQYLSDKNKAGRNGGVAAY